MLAVHFTPLQRPQAAAASEPVRVRNRALRGWIGGALFCIASGCLGCGGKVVVDGDSASGGTGGASSGASTSIAVTSATGFPSATSSSGAGGEGGAPPIPPLVEIDLGEVPVGELVDFEIPPGTLGFTVVAELTDPAQSSDLIGIKAILPPVGLPVVADYAIPTPKTLVTFVNYGITAAAVPQSDASPAMPLMPGTWRLDVDDDGMGATSAHVSVWRRQTIDGFFHGGKLDVNVFIADGSADPAYMDTAIQAAFQGYMGLSLGNITYQTLGPEWGVIDESTIHQALEQTAGAAGKPAVNVITVWQFAGDLQGAAGITAAAPALGLKHGTHLSGLFITPFEDLMIDTIILEHELGHFAGLFHTSEFEAGFGDALSDTPLCPDVTSQLETCPDYGNLMFPTGGDLLGTLTAQQIRVILASGVYRGIVEEGGGPAPPLPLVKEGGEAEGLSRAGVGVALAPGSLGATAGRGASLRWSAGLPPRAARFLAGHWCGSGAGGRPDFYGLLRSFGATDPGALLGVGLDPSAPVHVRRRALAAAGHGSPSARTLAELVNAAESASLPRGVRIGAIEGVAAAAGPAARALAGRLKGDADAVIARIAARVLP